MRVGIIAYQGGVYEHKYMVERAFKALGIGGEVVLVKRLEHLERLDAAILPGGESTTIGKLAERFGVLDRLKELISSGMPILGTCAGAVMLAKEVRDKVVGEVKQPTLAVMNVEVVRNYYGRQRESFEVDLKIRELGEKPFRGVFIRAPAIVRWWDGVEPLAKLDGVTVLARQGGIVAATFHPELSGDLRLHKYFLELAAGTR